MSDKKDRVLVLADAVEEMAYMLTLDMKRMKLDATSAHVQRLDEARLAYRAARHATQNARQGDSR